VTLEDHLHQWLLERGVDPDNPSTRLPVVHHSNCEPITLMEAIEGGVVERNPITLEWEFSTNRCKHGCTIWVEDMDEWRRLHPNLDIVYGGPGPLPLPREGHQQ
jgi:hypothetical protein